MAAIKNGGVSALPAYEHIVACATDQKVVASPTRQNVIPGPTIQNVARGVARQPIGPARTRRRRQK